HSAAFHADSSPEASLNIVEGLNDLEWPLLPILHALNEHFGFISDPAIKLVADVLNLTRAEVHGVVSFYHDFRRQPAGRHVIKVSRAEACQSTGCEDLVSRLELGLGIHLGETTRDHPITREEPYRL